MTLFTYNPQKKVKIGDYSYLTTVNGSMNEEFLRGFLVSNGIEPFIFREAISSSMPLNITNLSETDFYVSSEDLDTARELLKEIENS